MTKAERLFHQIADELPNVKESKMFGALCIKAKNGKSAAIFWKDEMTFKLNPENEKKALELKGARQGTHLYAPDRQMKGWVVVPFAYADQWKDLTKKSIECVIKPERWRSK